MRKYRIGKREGLWYFGQASCPVGPHICLGSIFNFFSPDHCGAAQSWEAAMKRVEERLKWDELERYRLMEGPLRM